MLIVRDFIFLPLCLISKDSPFFPFIIVSRAPGGRSDGAFDEVVLASIVRLEFEFNFTSPSPPTPAFVSSLQKAARSASERIPA